MSGKEGNVQREAVQGQETATGLQKEHFGTGTAAQSEAGKKGKHQIIDPRLLQINYPK